MTDNGALYGITDTADGMQRSTRMAEGLAIAPTAAPATTPVVNFAVRAESGSSSQTATEVTSTTHLTKPQVDFAARLRQITQGFSAGLGIPQSLEALLTLASAPERGAGKQTTPRTVQGAGTPTIHGMTVLAPGQRAAEYRTTSQPNQNTTASRNTASPHDRENVRNVQTRASD